MTLDFVPTLFMTISEKGRSVESVSHGTASFAVTLPHPMVSARRLYHLFATLARPSSVWPILRARWFYCAFGLRPRRFTADRFATRWVFHRVCSDRHRVRVISQNVPSDNCSKAWLGIPGMNPWSSGQSQANRPATPPGVAASVPALP